MFIVIIIIIIEPGQVFFLSFFKKFSRPQVKTNGREKLVTHQRECLIPVSLLRKSSQFHILTRVSSGSRSGPGPSPGPGLDGVPSGPVSRGLQAY